MNEPPARAAFRSMDEGTQQDWWVIGGHFMAYAAALPDRVLTHLRLLDGDYGGFPVDRLQHSLQTATRAHRAGEAEDYVVMALLHDIGDTLGAYNHPDIAAAILRPFVDDRLHWITQQHGIFQGYYFFHYVGLDRDMREAFRGHAHFADAARFCEIYDQAAFDPDYDSAPLDFFEPMVRRLFAAPKRSIYVGVAEFGLKGNSSMKSMFRAGLGAALLLLAACQMGGDDNAARPAAADAPAIAPILATPDAVDIHSFARPREARVHHVSLDLTVDFDAKRVGGTATLDIDRRPEAKQIILDSRGLEIAAVTDAAGEPLQYQIGAADPILGAPLAVALRPDTKRIAIRYTSAPDAEALQWLGPQQTAGKQRPYLFSQGQAILNRTWIPTQDSPGVRQTWDATIRVPAGLTAVMSAPRSAEPMTEGGESIFKFRMANNVPTYLIAIAVGDVKFQSLGARSGVWTEQATLGPAAAELADTEKMIDAAEGLFGPYLWQRYDMLVLPPSFPFGGMENPTLTFLTPTFIAGDKSLVSLIAHELAHSWSGNLATNATWADFWLNEGFTTYATTRIVEAIYGPRVAAQQIALGVDSMNKEMQDLDPADTRLHIDLKGRSPDDGLTEIAYEKGAAFLRTIEANVGRQRFDAWLKGWFDRQRFKPVTSAIFLADLRQHLVKGDQALEQKLMLDQWVYQPGLPSNIARPDPRAFADVDQAVAAFARGAAPDTAAWGRWKTDERLRFLNKLPRQLPKSRLDALDQAFGLNAIGNNEVRFAWLELAVANRYDPAVGSLEQFLTGLGRRKFVRPLIKSLAETEWGKPIAARIYARARPLYHPLVTQELDKLNLSNSSPAP